MRRPFKIFRAPRLPKVKHRVTVGDGEPIEPPPPPEDEPVDVLGVDDGSEDYVTDDEFIAAVLVEE